MSPIGSPLNVRGAGAYALVTVGLTAIFLSPLFSLYVGPRVEKAPIEVNTITKSTGNGSYYSLRLLRGVTDAQLIHTSVGTGDVARSTADVAVIDVFDQTSDRLRGEVNFGYSVIAFDRRTGLAVDCCGAKPKARGLVVRFPYGTRKTAYPFWDQVARQAFPARYRGTVAIGGLSTYVFVTVVPATLVSSQVVPGFLVGQPTQKSATAARLYEAATTLWVEPRTGAIVKATQHSQQWLAATTGRRLLTIADMSFVFDQATVDANVREASSEVRKLDLIRHQLPLAAPALGVVLVILGWLVLRSSDRRVHRATRAAPSLALAPVGDATIGAEPAEDPTRRG